MWKGIVSERGDIMAKAEIKVRLTDTDEFKEIVNILKEILLNEDIEVSLRQEYLDRLTKTLEDINKSE